MRIYVCSNPLVQEDSLPLHLLPALRKKLLKVEFVEFGPTENLPQEKELIIMDTVINAKNVIMLNDIDSFVQTKTLSLHDFDLGMNLKLAKKMGWMEKVTITGVPPGMDKDKVVKRISHLIFTTHCIQIKKSS